MPNHPIPAADTGLPERPTIRQRFSDLENNVGDARDMACVAMIVLEDVQQQRDTDGGCNDYVTLRLTEGQFSALDYSIRTLSRMIDHLHQEYYAAMAGGADV
jgi:hypothetical protein